MALVRKLRLVGSQMSWDVQLESAALEVLGLCCSSVWQGWYTIAAWLPVQRKRAFESYIGITRISVLLCGRGGTRPAAKRGGW